jgi:AcrR family transcriptional regulator
VGTVYHHFPGGLRDLEDALYLDTLASYQTHLLSALHQQRSADACVKALVIAHLGWVAGNVSKAQYLALFSDRWLSPENLATLQASNADFTRAMTDWCEPHMTAGRIRRMPNDLFDSIVLGPARYYASGIIEKLEDIEQAAEAIQAAGRALSDAAWFSVKGIES